MRTRSRATEDRAPKRRKKMAASRRSSSDTSSSLDTSSSSSCSSASSSSRTSLTSDDNETAGQSDWCSFLTAEEKRWMRGERDAASAGATQEVVIDDEDCDQMVRAAQLEEDEAFARSLQAQFDQEEVESHHHHFGRDGSPPPRQTGGRRRRRNAVPAPQHDFSGDDYEALLAFEERQGAVVSKKLTRGEVQRFPVKCYDGGGGNTQCQICFCDYERGERLRMLPCFHDYHADCVDRWLQENATCPICRVDLADL